MADQLEINGEYYEPLTEAFKGLHGPVGSSYPADGIWYVLPPFGNPPTAGPLVKDERQIKFPGTYAIGIKEMGPRTRLINCELMIVNSTKALVETSKDALFSTINGLSRFAVKVPGGTNRDGCRLIPGSGNPGEWLTIGTKICLKVALNFVHLNGT